MLAFLYVMLRIFYIMMYVSDMPTARSALWAGAFAVNIAILVILILRYLIIYLFY